MTAVATAELVDSHAHLQDRSFQAEMGQVLGRARLAGVVQVITAATTAEDSAEVVALAGRHPGVFAAVGVHPNDAAKASAGDWERVVELAASPGVVAIGETGLDRYRDRTPFDVQQEWFDRHLAEGHHRDLAVIIHCRNAERDILEQLARLGRPVRGVLHSFTGTWDDAQAFLDLGLYISFAGMITFTNRALDALRDVAARAPSDRILVETDSPYLSPHPHRGQPNEPARVAFTAAKVAEVRGVTLEALAEQTTRNARALFSLPDAPVL